MKRYPSIEKEIIKGEYTYLFDKLDGSNIRAEWTKKNQFYKFGSRTELIDKSHLLLGKAPQLIIDKYQADLTKKFKENIFFSALVCQYFLN